MYIVFRTIAVVHKSIRSQYQVSTPDHADHKSATAKSAAQFNWCICKLTRVSSFFAFQDSEDDEDYTSNSDGDEGEDQEDAHHHLV